MKELLDWFQTDVGYVVKIILYVILVVVCTFTISLISKKLFRKWIRRNQERGSKEQVITFLSALQHIVTALIYFGGVMALISQVPGLNKIATSLLAGSGVVAVALSVAAQSSIGNLVSGVLINLFKPIRVGDIIRYVDNDITGTVEEITLRHTIIRTFENKRLIVPNSTMNTQVIENSSYSNATVCLFLELEVSYECNLDQALNILQEQVERHPGHLDMRSEEDKAKGIPEARVRVQDFQSSGILLRAFVWAKNDLAAAQMKSDILRSVKQEYDRVGIEIPYPHRTLVWKQEETERPLEQPKSRPEHHLQS